MTGDAGLIPARGLGVLFDGLYWGSNNVMARTGTLYLDAARLAESQEMAARHQERALNYLHGANPVSKVYTANMGPFGAESSAGSSCHSWKPTPLNPGFVVGGPNPAYDWDACCPNACGNPVSNAARGKGRLSPPYGQPPPRSYLDFDDDWPLNSWQVSENSNGDQATCLRLLANFVA